MFDWFVENPAPGGITSPVHMMRDDTVTRRTFRRRTVKDEEPGTQMSNDERSRSSL